MSVTEKCTQSLNRNPHGKNRLGIPRSRLKNNIKVEFVTMGYEGGMGRTGSKQAHRGLQ
jgi:hypothetical protein